MLRRISNWISQEPPTASSGLKWSPQDPLYVNPSEGWRLSQGSQGPRPQESLSVVCVAPGPGWIEIQKLIGFQVRGVNRVVGTVQDVIIDEHAQILKMLVVELKASWTETWVPIRSEWIWGWNPVERIFDLRNLDPELIEGESRLETKKWSSPVLRGGLTPLA